MAGKSDWFCDMKGRSDSERVTRAFRSLEHRLCVQETHVYVYRRLTLFIVHTIKSSYFASLTNWDYFRLIGLFK